MCLKINLSVKTPWHRHSMGVTRSGLWADWPARIQTSCLIGPYNLHWIVLGIGALLCHHPYCLSSQSQTLFGIGLRGDVLQPEVRPFTFSSQTGKTVDTCNISVTFILIRPITAKIRTTTILGDPGAVTRVERKGATKVFKHRPKSPWAPTLTGPFPNVQANAGSWLDTKDALYYCAQSANSFSWVLFVSSYTTAIFSPQLPRSFTKLP